MTEREQLELAAKALGLNHTIYPKATNTGIFTDDAVWWNPLTDQADSDRLGCDLEIEIKFVTALGAAERNYVYASSRRSHKLSPDIEHNNTTEGRRAAVRQARLLVAVEIGRGCNGAL